MSTIHLPWFGADDITRLLSPGARSVCLHALREEGRMLRHAAMPAEGGVAARLADRILVQCATAAGLRQDRDRPEAAVKP
jgi:hypothetical protein